MTKRGVKPGSKRTPYKAKSNEEKAVKRAKRISTAEALLPMYLEPERKWSLEWEDPDLLEKTYLCSFAGLSTASAAKMLQCPEKELIEALKAIPDVSSHWARGQEEIVTLCHVALTRRISGMKTTETRVTTKADGGVETTTVVRELPPDTDAVKFFLQNRVVQYQEFNPASQFEGRLDTMLGRLEQMDLFG